MFSCYNSSDPRPTQRLPPLDADADAGVAAGFQQQQQQQQQDVLALEAGMETEL